MTSGQKVIKYLAITLAVFIIVSLASAIFYGISSIFLTFDKDNKNIFETNKYVEINDNHTITNLDIELSYTNLIIKNGNELKAETNNEDIEVRESNSKLIIREKKKKLFRDKNEYEIIIYLPDMIFDNVKVEAAAGKIDIQKLQTRNLDFEFGAGYAKISELIVLEDANLDGGAGKLEILGGNITNLDFDMGVGKAELTTALGGNSKIESGIGALDLNILGNREDFKIKVEKGIGSILIDDEKISKEEIFGNGVNYLELDGGIGKISLKFKK